MYKNDNYVVQCSKMGHFIITVIKISFNYFFTNIKQCTFWVHSVTKLPFTNGHQVMLYPIYFALKLARDSDRNIKTFRLFLMRTGDFK